MRLLIVEDNEELAELLAKGLRTAGYETDVLSTVEDARAVLSTTFYAALILTRMLSDRPIGYVDLRSPAGAGLGALVYNYDGSVFASDEGRMLAETGDNAFRLGHVDHDSYKSLVLSDKLIDAISSSLTQCAPECSTCVYESHCGADPVYHHATQGDALGIKLDDAIAFRVTHGIGKYQGTVIELRGRFQLF